MYGTPDGACVLRAIVEVSRTYGPLGDRHISYMCWRRVRVCIRSEQIHRALRNLYGLKSGVALFLTAEKQPHANAGNGSSPGIDRIGHQQQKRGLPRDDGLLRRLKLRLAQSQRVVERQ